MENIQQEDIHIISEFSNLSEKSIDTALKLNVYNNKDAWQKFLKLFLISLGVGFTVSGILFFFAYNWDDLNKFTKIGLTQGLVVLSTLIALLPKINQNIKNIILCGSSVLVGVLFAVYGQIYQTGANAYDFFLVWTIFITLWVVISNFAPLWLIYIVLINTTIFFYSEQVAHDWSEIEVLTILFTINTLVVFASLLISKYNEKLITPNWFNNTMVLSVVIYATIGIIYGIFNDNQDGFILLLIVTAIVYGIGIWNGFKVKSGFYLSLIPFSIIIIISALLIKISDGEMMFLTVSIFIISSVTLVIKNLLNLQKKWANEK